MQFQYLIKMTIALCIVVYALPGFGQNNITHPNAIVYNDHIPEGNEPPLLYIDTYNGRVGINTIPQYALEVEGKVVIRDIDEVVEIGRAHV